MLTKTRSTSGRWPTPGVIPDTITGPAYGATPVAGDPMPVAGDHSVAAAQPSATAERETRRVGSRRKAHRSRLHAYAIATVAVVAFLIALAASNTAQVKANWVFGSSRVSLVWLVLFAAILGWLLGLFLTAAFHWRTRPPRRGGGSS